MVLFFFFFFFFFTNAWQWGKLVQNKDSAPYKRMLGGRSLTGRRSLFLRGEVGTVLATHSQLSASHFKRRWVSDKCGALFRSIDDLPAFFWHGLMKHPTEWMQSVYPLYQSKFKRFFFEICTKPVRANDLKSKLGIGA